MTNHSLRQGARIGAKIQKTLHGLLVTGAILGAVVIVGSVIFTGATLIRWFDTHTISFRSPVIVKFQSPVVVTENEKEASRTAQLIKPSKTELRADLRVLKVRSMLEKYETPIATEAATFVKVADKYGLDYRLLPSLAMTESTGGKSPAPCTTYNAFGWKSISAPCGFWRFGSYKEAIAHVGECLANCPQYRSFQQEKTIPALASSYNLGSQKWINDVNYFMNEL